MRPADNRTRAAVSGDAGRNPLRATLGSSGTSPEGADAIRDFARPPLESAGRIRVRYRSPGEMAPRTLPLDDESGE